MKAQPIQLDIPVCELGEGPFWDSRTNRLSWVDIEGKNIYCHEFGKFRMEKFITPSMVGFAVPNVNDEMIVGLQDGIYMANLNSNIFTFLAAPNSMNTNNRFNDGKCDRLGRLWCGTMNLRPANSLPTGALYRYDSRGLVCFEDKIFISNGIGWSPDNKTMYYTDTFRQVIWQYDYDIETGIPSNKRVFTQIDQAGSPDGLTVDSRGRVFIALWGGWGVEIYTPSGKLVERIDLPVPQVSSCIFGGLDLKTLYITTARSGLTQDQLREARLSGYIFAANMDVPGIPEVPYGSLGDFPI